MFKFKRSGYCNGKKVSPFSIELCKFFLIILITLCIVGCGVKSKPLSPPEDAIQSYLKNYTDDNPTFLNKDNSLKKSK